LNTELGLAAIALAGMSGVPGLMLPRGSNLGQRIATVLSVAASITGIWAAFRTLLLGPDPPRSLPLSMFGAEISIGIDALSAAFLLPIFVISGAAALFGEGYWKQSKNPRNGRKLRLFYGLLTAGLALLVASRDGASFLLGWEVMALSCFLAMSAEDDKKEVREASWIYFASTHVSTLILFAFFALYFAVKGSLVLEPFPVDRVDTAAANALFLLALAGFGLKAGIYPLHFWLPPAHASAPSHVSALMSGVLIKMGVYGMLRVCWLLPHVPLWWGGCLLALGCVSGVMGVAFAIAQHDLKRLLAYHSIENIGIIFMGMGLAVAGRSLGRPDWTTLGLCGAVLHTWNHGLFKALLFLAAGSTIHAVHTREIDRLGGLSKRMPLTAFFFLVGAAAICGLPPLNGFISEVFIYLGLFRTVSDVSVLTWALPLAGIPILALVGGLALACFVKVYGAVFLGVPRTECAELARESGAAMTAPMALLASACLWIGIAPGTIAPLLDPVAKFWAGGAAGAAVPLAAVAPLGWLGLAAGATALAIVAATLVFLRSSASAASALPTWDCGYAASAPSMQYTASSLAQGVVGLFSWLLLPSSSRPGAARPFAAGPFPVRAKFHQKVPDVILDRTILPAFGAVAWACFWFRLLQRGKINAYLLYVFITLLILLLWN